MHYSPAGSGRESARSVRLRPPDPAHRGGRERPASGFGLFRLTQHASFYKRFLRNVLERLQVRQRYGERTVQQRCHK